MKRQKMKFVRINEKTVIEIPVNKPDEEARSEFLLKIEANNRKYEHYKINERWK